MSHIFISYSSSDRDYAESLSSELQRRGFDIWLDYQSIKGGQRWVKEISSAVKESGALIAIMTSQSERSEWVENEILIAKRHNIPIFPLLLEGQEFEMLIGTQFENVTGGKMPPDSFFTLLAQAQPPHLSRLGKDVTSADLPEGTQEIRRQLFQSSRFFIISTAIFALIVFVIGIATFFKDAGRNSEKAPSVETEALEFDQPDITWSPVYTPIPTTTQIIPSYSVQKLHVTIPSGGAAFYEKPSTNSQRVLATTSGEFEVIGIHKDSRDVIWFLTDITDFEAPASIAWLSANQIDSMSNSLYSLSALNIHEDLLRLAHTGITQANDWLPLIETFGGIEMVLVPKGCFMMGSNISSDEQPIHEQCFDEPFWLDMYEVTNAQYGSTGCTNYSSRPNQPRNCVTWFEARDYCENRGVRLPTEAEWEFASRGPNSLIYPWGNVLIEQNAIYENSFEFRDKQTTTPVGSNLAGISWVGALNMSGNVLEWTSSIFMEYPYASDDGREANTSDRRDIRRVLRGGSFHDPEDWLRAAHRFSFDPGYEASHSGFGVRCARSFN